MTMGERVWNLQILQISIIIIHQDTARCPASTWQLSPVEVEVEATEALEHRKTNTHGLSVCHCNRTPATWQPGDNPRCCQNGAVAVPLLPRKLCHALKSMPWDPSAIRRPMEERDPLKKNLIFGFDSLES